MTDPGTATGPVDEPTEPAVPTEPAEPMAPDTGPAGESAVARVVRELERHAAEAGWDRPAQLFALVPTADLVEREPGLAEVLDAAAELTPVQQDELPGDQLEVLLEGIVWPPQVAGCAAVVERLVLPPGADEGIPADPDEAAAWAAGHPDRQEVRIVAAATRDGGGWSALRLRDHDDPGSVLIGEDLVPGLLDLLRLTLEPEPDEADGPAGAASAGVEPRPDALPDLEPDAQSDPEPDSQPDDPDVAR